MHSRYVCMVGTYAWWIHMHGGYKIKQKINVIEEWDMVKLYLEWSKFMRHGTI